MNLQSTATLMGVSILLLFGTPVVVPAQTPACTYDATTHTVSASDAGDISVVEGRIHVQRVPCDDATVLNTDTINVTSASTLFDIYSGLAPGFIPESEGRSEIEVSIEAGFSDMYMTVYGTEQADDMVLGTGSLNTNGDDDPDVVAAPVIYLEHSTPWR